MARKMKDSGIEWIGDIPEGWEIRKIKNNFMIYAGATPKSEKTEYWDGGIPWITPADFKTTDKYVSYGRKSLTALGYDSCGTTLVPTGSIIFSKRAPVGSVVIAKNALCTNQGCLACIPNDAVNSTYFYYCMSIFTEQFELVSAGTTFKEIAASTFASFLLPCPPLSQQNEIVNFLDKESSRIDSMLSKTRSSIEEYKKLKQAVITQAVTKGVRGEREMKDSGVEWIGEIPREFDPVQLKFFCKLITDGTHFSPTTVENGWPYITAGDVHGIGLDYNSAKRISEEDFQLLVAQGCQPLKGDVLLVKDGATTGRVGFVDSDTPCVILSSVAMLRPADNTDGHYLMYLLASDFLQKQILVSMAGSAMPRTTLTKLTKYIGLLSPLHEQKEIANYLDAKCAKIDGLIAKKEQLVKELESYKKSLIYEVVTGKREV